MHIFILFQGCVKTRRSATRTVYVCGKLPPDLDVQFQEKFPDNKVISSKVSQIDVSCFWSKQRSKR